MQLTAAARRPAPAPRWRLASVVLACLLGAPAPALAGPWTRDLGRWYFKLGQSVFVAEGFRDADGNFNTESSYLGLNTFAYGEVGLGSSLQAQFYLPFTVGRSAFDEDSPLRTSTRCENGLLVDATTRRTFGDALLGLQWTSPLFAMPHAVRLETKLPLYDVGEPEGACAVLFPQPGDGQLDHTLWLSLGDSLDDVPLYLFAEVGHRMRTEVYLGDDSGQSYGETFVFFGQIGWEVMQGGFVILNLQASHPYTDDRVSKGSLSLGPAVYFPVGSGFAVEAGLELTPLATNSSQGTASRLFWTGASVGVSHKHD